MTAMTPDDELDDAWLREGDPDYWLERLAYLMAEMFVECGCPRPPVEVIKYVFGPPFDPEAVEDEIYVGECDIHFRQGASKPITIYISEYDCQVHTGDEDTAAVLAHE